MHEPKHIDSQLFDAATRIKRVSDAARAASDALNQPEPDVSRAVAPSQPTPAPSFDKAKR